MALDLNSISALVGMVTVILDKAKDAAPGVLESAKKLAASAQDLVSQVKSSLDDLLHPTMTPEQTKAALDSASKKLDAALKAVEDAPVPKEETE